MEEIDLIVFEAEGSVVIIYEISFKYKSEISRKLREKCLVTKKHKRWGWEISLWPQFWK